MKIVVKILGSLIGLYLLLMLGSGLAIRTLLSTELGDRLRDRAQQSLPVEVSLSGGEFDIAEWMLFRPALALHDLRVGNPAGYGEDALLSADRVFARAGLLGLLRGETRITVLQLDAPVLRVQTDQAGRTNIEALLAALSRSEAPASGEDAASAPAELSIDNLRITAGRIVYSSLDQSDFIVKNVEIAAENITLQDAFNFSASLDLFEEEAVSLRFAGVAGPFSSSSLPVNGALAVHASPGRVPADFRRQTFGAFLESPGSSSALDIAVDVEGDLFGVVVGGGTIDFADVRLGREAAAPLPLSGQAQVLLTLLNPIANPAFHVIMPDASLAFGQGRWQGGVEAQYDGQLLSGKSAGAIDGVDINEMMTAFTDAADVAFGNLTMPRYELRFSGRDADQIFNSLTGVGRLELSNGRFALFDTLQTIQGNARKLLSGSEATAGATSFVDFGSDLEVRGQRVYTSGIALQSDELRITGGGSFGFDQSLAIDLDSAVSGALAELLGGSRDSSGAAWVIVPLRIRGSVADPSVSPDLGRLIKNEAVRRATGLLDVLINGKSEEPAEGETPEEAPEEEPKPRLPFDLGDILRRKLSGAEPQ